MFRLTPSRRLAIFAVALLPVLLVFQACQRSPRPLAPRDPASLEGLATVSWQEVEPYFRWNLPGLPRQDGTPGDVVPIVHVENPEDYEKANAQHMAACPSSDYHASFVKAFYLPWEGRVVVSYCFREGMPGRDRFQIYYLPVLDLRREAFPDADCEQRESDPKLAFSPHWGVCLDTKPATSSDAWPGDDLLIFYASSPAGRNWESPEAQARDRVRLLFIETPTRLYTVSLSDIHPYLSPETHARLSADPAQAGLLYGGELHWRAIRPARITLDICEARNDDSPPARWRDALLRRGKTIHPRTSCVERAALLPDDEPRAARLGYAFRGYVPGSENVGWLLLRQAQALSVFPVGYSGHPRLEGGVRLRLEMDPVPVK